MTPDDATPETGALTRRDLRARTQSTETVATLTPAPPVEVELVEGDVAEPPAASDPASDLAAMLTPVGWADAETPATALTWVDPQAVALHTHAATLDAPVEADAGADLLAAAPRGAAWRSGVFVPLGTAATLALAYAATTLLWPLHAVAPTIAAAEFDSTPAAATAIVWPGQGSAAVGVTGVASSASGTDALPIASITKVVSSLMVLDRMPLAVGEQGPSYEFTRSDSREYWSYRRDGQSALDVPVGGTLTQFQLLQGTLIGSANNYIDFLSDEIWGSDRAYADAAAEWLRERGISGITVVNPSGRDARNVATPQALLELADRAMDNPVIAEIVGTTSVELPGAGLVTNTNGLLGDEGVVGVKTGTLAHDWNLLTAKEITLDGTTVRLTAAVLDQDDDEQRVAESRSLFAQLEAELIAQPPVVTAGTVVGEVRTIWGVSVDVVTDADAKAVLWNSASAAAGVELDLGDRRDAGDAVGTLTVTGPIDAGSVSVSLADDVAGPSPWWRLTHPLELFGLADSPQS